MEQFSPIEAIAVVLNLAYVVLAIVQSVWCWPMGFAGAGVTFVVYLQARFPWNTGLQVLYMALMVYGWYEWRHGEREGGSLPVTRTPRRWWIGLSLAATAFTLLGAFAARLMEAAVPFWDAGTTGFSLVAQFMTTRKWIETWLVWIAVDVFYVVMLISQRLHLMAGLYLIYAVLAVGGFLRWRRSSRESARS